MSHPVTKFRDLRVLERVATGSFKFVRGESEMAGVKMRPTPKKAVRVKAEMAKLTDQLARRVRDLEAAAMNERLARKLYINSIAKQALGSDALVRKFMSRKHPVLKATPESRLDTEWGAREVEDLLFGMMHGLPA